MTLADLKKPFPADEIEWRIGQSGKKGNGQIWATCLAYVTGRAILDRLDEVCGPDNWRVSYRFIPKSEGTTPGVMCEISVLVGDRWVTKEDGAEQTDIESFKGGISSALKRAGSAWGIGRYLYSLESGFATICDRGEAGSKWAKTKDGAEFHWRAPTLPAWALPATSGAKDNKPTNEIDARPQSNGIHAQQPTDQDGITTPTHYKIQFGQWKQRTLEQVYEMHGADKLADYIDYLKGAAAKKGQVVTGEAAEFVVNATQFLKVMEGALPEGPSL